LVFLPSTVFFQFGQIFFAHGNFQPKGPAKRCPAKPLLRDPTWIILLPGFPAGCMLHRLSYKKSTSGQPRVPGPLSHKDFISGPFIRDILII